MNTDLGYSQTAKSWSTTLQQLSTYAEVFYEEKICCGSQEHLDLGNSFNNNINIMN